MASPSDVNISLRLLWFECEMFPYTQVTPVLDPKFVHCRQSLQNFWEVEPH